MKHEEIKELLPLYIDNDLTDQEKTILEHHLQECEECQEELKKYQENRELLLSLRKEKVPKNLVETVMNKFDQEIKEKEPTNKMDISLKRIKDFITSPVKVPAGVMGLAAVILIIAITGLPAVFQNNNDFLSNNKTVDYYTEDYLAAPESFSTSDTTRSKALDSSQQQSFNLSDTTNPNTDFEQKIIKTADLIIELSNIDNINNNIVSLIEGYDGYIANSRNWLNQYNQKSFWFEIKVPADNFNIVLEKLAGKEYGQLISRTVSSQDVTEEYMDLDIRLENLLSQEERYRQLLDKATGVEDMLKIENELTRIRTEVERLQGRKNYLDNRISFSTITVEFRQPEPITSGTPGIIRAIRNAASKMVDQFYKIIILIGTAIPYLLIVAAGYLVYRRSRRR